MRRRVEDTAQAAILLVVGITVLLATVGGVLITNIANNDPIITQASIQRYAYRALISGLSSYQSIINADPYLAACNSSTNGTAQCSGVSYGTWSQVPDTDLGNGIIPEYYKFDNPQSVIDPASHTLTSLQVQVVGAAGFPGKNVNYSTIARFVPANGFLNNVWWTNFESQGNPLSCQYWWAPSGGGHAAYQDSGGCNPVYFIGTDTLNGPVFSNDSIFIDGQPNFSSQFSSPPPSVTWGATTADPSCQFVDPGDGNNGYPSTITIGGRPGTCAQAATNDMGFYNSATSSFGPKNKQTIPSDNLKLGPFAQQAGCYYVGPTMITLSGSTMKVLSPESATDPNRNFSSNPNTCPTNGTTSAPLPSNGVVYVDANPSGNPTVAGVNPFDGYRGACAGGPPCDSQLGSSPVTGTPDYWGQTISPDTEGDVFVQGSLSGHLTISANNDVVIDGPLTYADCTGWAGTAHETACNYNDATTTTPNDTLGLIAYNYVEVSRPVDSNGRVLPACTGPQVLTYPLTSATAPLCDPATSSGSPKGAGLTIDASILALQQSFAVNSNDARAPGGGGNTVEGALTIYGSIQQNARGPVGTFGGGGIATGYGKDYNFDPRLALYSPPYYLTPGTPSWNLDSSAESYTGNCPAMPPPQPRPSTTPIPWPGVNSSTIPTGWSACVPAS